MPKIKLDIVGAAYWMRSTQLDAQRCVNWYLTVDPTGKYQSVLLPRPGLELLIEGESYEKNVRGLLSLRGDLYAVVDDKLYVCGSTGRKRIIGELKTALGLVSILANETQLFISDGIYGYIYQLVESPTHEKGDFFIVTKTHSNVSDPVFNGGGIDDMVISPQTDYDGDDEKIYVVQIDTQQEFFDTYKWSEDGGSTWEEERVHITGGDQLLNNNIYIKFDNLTGHDVFDRWDFRASPDTEFYAPLVPTYQDGYGIYPRNNTNRFYITSIRDLSRINATEWATTSVYPDNLQAAVSIHDEVYLIGETTTEIWYDVGELEFPFRRKRNVVLNYGTEAPFTVRVGAENIIFMLASNYEGGRIIIKIENYNVTMISSEPINEELRLYRGVKDAFGYVIERNGHVFYLITFPEMEKTWVYDLTTRLWHEWRSVRGQEAIVDEQDINGMFIGSCHTVFEGEDIVGDFFSGNIYKLSERSFNDNGKIIVCERTSRHLTDSNDYISINSLQLDFEAGVGKYSLGIEDPQVMLQISKDGGRTWGSEMWRSIGKTGEFKNRALWYRLGTARTFTFRVKMTDSVYRVLLGAVADVEVLD